MPAQKRFQLPVFPEGLDARYRQDESKLACGARGATGFTLLSLAVIVLVPLMGLYSLNAPLNARDVLQVLWSVGFPGLAAPGLVAWLAAGLVLFIAGVLLPAVVATRARRTT